jgi:hypothetical protein
MEAKPNTRYNIISSIPKHLNNIQLSEMDFRSKRGNIENYYRNGIPTSREAPMEKQKQGVRRCVNGSELIRKATTLWSPSASPGRCRRRGYW